MCKFYISALVGIIIEWLFSAFMTVWCTETANVYFISNNFSSRNSCRLWDNIEKYGRISQATVDNILQCMYIACWIPKATHTHTLRICNSYCCSTATSAVRMRPNIMLYLQSLSLFGTLRTVQYWWLKSVYCIVSLIGAGGNAIKGFW